VYLLLDIRQGATGQIEQRAVGRLMIPKDARSDRLEEGLLPVREPRPQNVLSRRRRHPTTHELRDPGQKSGECPELRRDVVPPYRHGVLFIVIGDSSGVREPRANDVLSGRCQHPTTQEPPRW
jgi:hypothetical protein